MSSIARHPYRPDIQGLRAVAVGLVVLYHAKVPGITGGFVGVDVFYVISGFLITNHLLASYDRDGRVRFLAFYSRRALRILPASFVVLGLTLVASAIWLPRLQWRSTLQDAAATALYVPNVLFAVKDTDYLADTTPSVLQHYWSLGIEEQFYLAWPAVLAVLCWALGRSSHRALGLFLGGLVAISLAACVYLTPINPAQAFFLPHTRVWELAAGGLLAVTMPGLKRTPGVAAATAGTLAGLGALVGAAFMYSDNTEFPGLAALVPVAGSAAIIFFGAHAAPLAARILSNPPMVFIGAISYSLYLVHWPLLVLPEQAGGVGRQLGLGTSCALAILAIPVAFALHRFVEEPARRAVWPRRRPKTAVAAALGMSAALAIAALGGLYAFRYVPLDAGRPAESVPLSSPPLFTSYVPSNLRPSLTAARDDNPAVYADGCHANFKAVKPLGCTFGTETAVAPEVVLFGDSHAAQWFPALQRLADAGEIVLRVETKSSCPAPDVVTYHEGDEYLACAQWRDNVIASLEDDPPDAIVMSSYARFHGFDRSADLIDQWASGLERVLQAVSETTQVVVLADTPVLPSQPPVCLSAHLDDTSPCSAPRSVAISTELVQAERAAAERQGATYLDVTDYICDPRICGTITGNVLMYRDDNHLSATFAASFAPLILPAVSRQR